MSLKGINYNKQYVSQVDKDDGLPKWLCITCSADIIKVFTIKQQFIRANSILREKLLTANKNNNLGTAMEINEEVFKEKFEDMSENFNEHTEINSDNHNYFSDENEENKTNIYAANNENIYSNTNTVNEIFIINEENSSDDEKLKRKKEEIQEKLKSLPNNCEETSQLTDKAITSYLKEYKKKPKDKLSYTCDICNKTLCSSTSLKTHMLSHTNETKWPFLCSVCGKGFKTKLTYQEHLVTHDPSDPFKVNNK